VLASAWTNQVRDRAGHFTKDRRSAIRQGFRRLFLGRRGPCSSTRTPPNTVAARPPDPLTSPPHFHGAPQRAGSGRTAESFSPRLLLAPGYYFDGLRP